MTLHFVFLLFLFTPSVRRSFFCVFLRESIPLSPRRRLLSCSVFLPNTCASQRLQFQTAFLSTSFSRGIRFSTFPIFTTCCFRCPSLHSFIRWRPWKPQQTIYSHLPTIATLLQLVFLCVFIVILFYYFLFSVVFLIFSFFFKFLFFIA